MPTDAVKYADRMEAELLRFGQLFRKMNADIEAAHEAHEVACKWPMIEDGDFDGVFDTVYAPHIEILGRQRRAVLDVADALEKAGPPEVVGDAVEAYRAVGQSLLEGLALQLKVCEDDFDPDACASFRDAARAAVAEDGLVEHDVTAPSDAPTPSDTP